MRNKGVLVYLYSKASIAVSKTGIDSFLGTLRESNDTYPIIGHPYRPPVEDPVAHRRWSSLLLFYSPIPPCTASSAHPPPSTRPIQKSKSPKNGNTDFEVMPYGQTSNPYSVQFLPNLYKTSFCSH